jgi:ankyrin repeat protein
MILAKGLIFILLLVFCHGRGLSEDVQLNGIWNAAANGHFTEVQKHLAAGEKINNQEKIRGFTPLMVAIDCFQTELVDDLLKLGGDPNLVSLEGYTALSLAARNADVGLMKKLIDAGAKIDLGTDQIGTLVRQTLYSGSVEAFQLLLDAGFQINRSIQNLIPSDSARGNTMTPLHLAAYKGNTEVVELILKNGADINSKASAYGNTPLLYAVITENPFTAKRLIELGADMSLVNDVGNGAFFYAAKNLHEDCSVVLMKAGAPLAGKMGSILSHAWKRGNTELLEYLAAKGLKLPAADPLAALLKAVRDNDVTQTKQLLGTGFYDFNAQAHCVLGPGAAIGNPVMLDDLHSAAGNGDCLSDRDASGFSQLHLTVMGNHLEAMDFYLRNKTNTENTDVLGQTPIMTAARLGKIDAMSRLLKAGAKLDRLDKKGLNALDLAYQANQKDAIAWLEAQGIKRTRNEPSITEEKRLPPLKPTSEHLPSMSIALTPLSLINDGWYQSQETAHDFCALLQPRLESIDGLDWVERAEIAKAEAEIKLANSGFLSATQSLAIGQWIKSDLILTGSLNINFGLGRELNLRVVDARRGDVLAERTLRLQQPLAAPLTITAEAIDQAQVAAASAITEARSRLQEMKGQIVLAPLFISNRTELNPRLDLPAARLITHAQKAVQGKGVRLLNLLGSTDAYQESELAISGLAQQDSEACKQVADHYLWGWCEEIGPVETPFSQMPIKITLELWSGGEDTQKFTQETTSPHLDEAAIHLMQRAFSALAKTKQTSTKGAEKVSKAMLLSAKALIQGQGQDRFYRGNLWKIQRWQLAVKILDIARFFSPNDPEIASHWLLERWNNAIYEREDSSDVDDWSFENVSRMKADWDHVISRFGFEGFKSIPLDDALMYKKPHADSSNFSGFQVISWFGVCYSLTETFSAWNYNASDGMPPEKRRLLQKTFMTETAERYLQVRESPLYEQAPPMHSMQMLMPSLPLEVRLKIAKAVFEDAKKTPRNDLDFLKFRATELQFFGLAGRYEAGKEALSLTGIQRYPEQTTFVKRAKNAPENPKVVVPATASAFRTKAKPYPLQGPWGRMPLTVYKTHSGGFFAVMQLHYQDPKTLQSISNLALWLPQSSRLISIKPAPYLGCHTADFFAEAPGEIWMSDTKNGISRINLASREQVFFKESDGTPFQRAESGAAAGEEFFCVGETQSKRPSIAAFHPTLGWRFLPIHLGNQAIEPEGIKLTSCNHLLYAHIMPQNLMLVYDTLTGQWRKLSAKGPSRFWFAAPDASGLWVPEAHGIKLLSPVDGQTKTIKLPSDINWELADLTHDGDWLWVALTKPVSRVSNDGLCSSLLAIHKPTLSYRGCVDFSFRCSFRALIVTPKTLFPVLNCYGIAGAHFFSIDKAELIQEAESRGK